MNILLLDQFSDLGGAQRCLLELLPAIRDRGWRAHVAAPGDGALRDRALAAGASYRQIDCGPYQSGGKSTSDIFYFVRELPRLAHEIANLAAACSAGIVYINGPRLLPAARLGLADSLPLVFHCHSYLRQRYAAALAGISLAGAPATVIASCGFVAEPLRPYLKSTVIYNGVTCPIAGRTVLPSAQLEESACGARADGKTVRPTLGVIGRIAPEKGQLDFLQAARLLPANYRFVVCGAPLFSNAAAASYYDQVQKCAAGLPVEFLGWRDDIETVLSTLDLLVVPSAPGEATTRVILEAFAAGVPVVASNSGGIPEIVTDGETGFLTPPGDPARLAARIREALEHPPALRRIAENAHRAARERFSLAQYQDRVMSILERVGRMART